MTTIDPIYIGIVGNEAAKFTPHGERQARALIRELLRPENAVLVSGGCHLGGVDIWAEEEYAALRAVEYRPDPIIHLPRVREWKKGYQPRNLAIARDSAVVHNISIARYADAFSDPKFRSCYHCDRRFRETGKATLLHVKSGGCWTAYEAEKMGKFAVWHVLGNEEGDSV